MEKSRELFDTALTRIRHEIKSRLAGHGLFGSVSYIDIGPSDAVPTGSKIEIAAKGKTASMTFERVEIESCGLRVSGPVLSGIIAMVDELSASRG